MRRAMLLVPLLALAWSPGPIAAQSRTRTLYVAPRAAGAGDGASAANAAGDLAATLERALVDTQVGEVALLPGTYALDRPITLKPSRPFVIRAAWAGTAILDGGGRTATALTINGGGLAVQDLVFRNFRENGIVLIGSERVVIQGNRFANISSTAWSQAAIHGLHYLVGIRILDNSIADTGYGGILFEAGEDGRLNDIVIQGNRLFRTCLTVADCGAIYAQGRSRASGGFVITDNVIRDFGPRGASAQGIYLDDWLSDAVVRGNIITGTGEFALHLHGGSGNRVTGNTIDVCDAKGVLFYQDAGGPRDARRMRDNRLDGNTVRVASGRRGDMVKLDLDKSAALGLEGNRLADCARSSTGAPRPGGHRKGE